MTSWKYINATFLYLLNNKLNSKTFSSNKVKEFKLKMREVISIHVGQGGI